MCTTSLHHRWPISRIHIDTQLRPIVAFFAVIYQTKNNNNDALGLYKRRSRHKNREHNGLKNLSRRSCIITVTLSLSYLHERWTGHHPMTHKLSLRKLCGTLRDVADDTMRQNKKVFAIPFHYYIYEMRRLHRDFHRRYHFLFALPLEMVVLFLFCVDTSQRHSPRRWTQKMWCIDHKSCQWRWCWYNSWTTMVSVVINANKEQHLDIDRKKKEEKTQETFLFLSWQIDALHWTKTIWCCVGMKDKE